jgi:CDP-diglyceride synthetase
VFGAQTGGSVSNEPRDRPTERTEGDEDEDFEPLDRFFAPIEDVDWTDEGAGEERTAEPAAVEPPATEPLVDEELLPTADIPLDPLADLVESEEREGTGAAGEGQGSFPVEEGPSWQEPPQQEISVEDLKTPPAAYADLPGPRDEDQEQEAAVSGPPANEGVGEIEEAEVEELDEIEPDDVLEPDLDQVEAAADHFAESLRSEDEPAPLAADTGVLPPPDQVERELLSDLEPEPTPPPTVTVGVTESLGGPSWQEPTSREVGPSVTPPPAGGRNLPLAFITGIVLLAIGITTIAIGKGPFAVVAVAAIMLTQGELFAALHRRGYQPATAVGLVFAGMISSAAYLKGEAGAMAMLALGVITTFAWFMATPAKARQNTVINLALTVFSLVYVGFLASYALTILALNGGRTLVLAVIGLAVGYDIAAYGAGSLFGNRALAPSISPRKSVEGAAIATIIILLASVLILPSLDVWSSMTSGNGLVQAVGLALVISIFAPLGDLAESLLKRDLGIKDMGSILPGHGGLLDRLDSLLFAAPAAFYFFRLFLS